MRQSKLFDITAVTIPATTDNANGSKIKTQDAQQWKPHVINFFEDKWGIRGSRLCAIFAKMRI